MERSHIMEFAFADTITAHLHDIAAVLQCVLLADHRRREFSFFAHRCESNIQLVCQHSAKKKAADPQGNAALKPMRCEQAALIGNVYPVIFS